MGLERRQEMLTKFYGDIHTLICAYNPRYFVKHGRNKTKRIIT